MIDSPLISNFIFYPRRQKLPDQLDDHFTQLNFHMPDSIQLSALHISIDASQPTILFFHGNGEIVNDYLHLYNLYTSSTGFNFAVVDYRGYGESGGTPSYSKLFKDPPHVYDQLRNWLTDHDHNDQVVVMGRSLGSTCASVIASQQPEGLKGMIIESGFCNLFELTKSLSPHLASSMDGSMRHELHKWSNDKLISKIQVPTLVIHGKRDSIVPFSQAEQIVSLLSDTIPVEFEVIQNANHNNIMSFGEYRQALKRFSNKIHT